MYCKHVCRQDSRGKVKCSVARRSFSLHIELGRIPPQRPCRRPPAAGETRLSGRRQVNFRISIRIESGVFCCVNDSTVVSICVALAGLERLERLLNKGVSGDGERKDHVSQSAGWGRKKKDREG